MKLRASSEAFELHVPTFRKTPYRYQKSLSNLLRFVLGCRLALRAWQSPGNRVGLVECSRQPRRQPLSHPPTPRDVAPASITVVLNGMTALKR